MQTYKQASEGYEPKCSVEEVLNNLIEMYTYHFKLAAEADRDDPKKDYEVGRADGAMEAIQAILLAVVGGGQMYDIWQSTLKWVHSEE